MERSTQFAVTAAAVVLLAVPSATAETPVSPVPREGAASGMDEPVGRYLEALEKSGRLSSQTATVERLSELVVQAENHLINADARAATTLLFAVVESARFQGFKDTATFQNAEFLLGRALFMGRAHRSATHYLERILARGPAAPYFVPAVRLLVDMALDSGRLDAIVVRMQAALANRDLPPDSAAEMAYLQGRVAYRKGDWITADKHFSQVGRLSRLHPAALYFRGLVFVQQGRLLEARENFCRIVDQKDQARVSFNVDDRFFRLKDMAHLALGRLAHEQDRYDEAYYFYFSIPEESQRLPAALFEAAWSMMQKGEFQAARTFADQFDRLFPHHALRPELSILRANLAVKTCAFDLARAEADALVRRYQPVQALAARAVRDVGLQTRIMDRLLDPGRRGNESDLEAQLIAVLKLDPKFDAALIDIADLDVEIAEGIRAVKSWRDLGQLAESSRQTQPVVASVEAVKLLEDAAALAESSRGLPALGRESARLVLDVSLLAFPPEQAGPYGQEALMAEALVRDLTAVRAGMIASVRDMLSMAISEADERLRAIIRQTRLVHIDAVVGKKKKLEIEIGRLVEGRLTADTFRKLAVEGDIGDDEIYWPYEGEMWADEYEGYR